MKMPQQLRMSGPYQDLSKGNHHPPIVPAQSGTEECRKRKVKGVFTGQSGTKLVLCVPVCYQKDDVN